MKFGKKNEIQVNPLMYNMMLIGESGIGKTTIMKEYCEKLAGEDGYIFLEIGKEDGASSINGINYLNCPEWDMDYDEDTNSIGFNTFIEDVIDNKSSDWKDLKVVVIDTYDELFAIAEPEVSNMHNRENPNKRVKSIKAAFGGFQAGEDKAIEIVLESLWSLKKVGVSFIVIGHTKNRNVTDPVTGEDYLQLTSNMSQKYFNAMKTKVHFLGVAAIDREIVKVKTGKKNIATKEDIKKGVVKSETRKITFRDETKLIMLSDNAFPLFNQNLASNYFLKWKNKYMKMKGENDISVLQIPAESQATVLRQFYSNHSYTKTDLLGCNITDLYFDPAFIVKSRKKLINLFPEARGKKVLLYAPYAKTRNRCR